MLVQCGGVYNKILTIISQLNEACMHHRQVFLKVNKEIFDIKVKRLYFIGGGTGGGD